MYIFKVLFLLVLIFNFYVKAVIPGLNLNEIKDKILIRTNTMEPGSIVYNFNINVANLPKEITKSELQEQLKSIFEESRSSVKSVKEFIDQNKLILSACSFSAIYFVILYKLVSVNKLLNSYNAWLAWKADLPFEKLTSISHIELSKELLAEINKRSIESNNFIKSNPLLNFINEINSELAKLQSYITLTNFLKSLWLSGIYKINNESIRLVQEKISRLNYLKNIFLNNIFANSLMLIQKNESSIVPNQPAISA